jgi:hypothetical protein
VTLFTTQSQPSGDAVVGVGDESTAAGAAVSGKLVVRVTYDEAKGYVGSAPELRQPIVALSLGGLRRQVEALMSPDEIHAVLQLDRGARQKHDRRRRMRATGVGRSRHHQLSPRI